MLFFVVRLENMLAIQYAREALLFFDKHTSKESKHRIYSLNIYCYYIIDSASDEEYKKITNWIKELIVLKSSINSWHFRYDDTIARSFHRRALMEKSKADKIEYATTALKIIKESLSRLNDLDGRDVKEVQSYSWLLQTYISDLRDIGE